MCCQCRTCLQLLPVHATMHLHAQPSPAPRPTLLTGSTVSTKHGNVNTDYILFICSGAFHSCKPSDMLAELQGRLPIRVELKGLTCVALGCTCGGLEWGPAAGCWRGCDVLVRCSIAAAAGHCNALCPPCLLSACPVLRSADDFYKILTEPESNMVKQQQALMATENVNLIFTGAWELGT